MKGFVLGVRMAKDSDGWKITDEEFDVEFEASPASYEIECFQFERPISDLSDIEWAEIRRIAMECKKRRLYDGDQFKCTIEAYARWIALTAVNQDLSEEVTKHKPKTIQ